MINVNPIANTNQAGAIVAGNWIPQTDIGDFGGVANFGRANISFRQSFTEHGYIIGLISVRGDLNYQEGLDRMWQRRTRYEHYWPALAHLGEQAILNREIYAQGTAGGSADGNVFGYQERYAEYRYKPSKITGRFRSNSASPLDSWHIAQDFSALPLLNASFIEENPPIDRIIAVTSSLEPQIIADFFFDYKSARPMPVFGVPGLIDHF